MSEHTPKPWKFEHYGDRIVLCDNALTGIASATPGSVKRLVEAAKAAIDGLCDPDRSGGDVCRLLVKFNTALGEIKVEDTITPTERSVIVSPTHTEISANRPSPTHPVTLSPTQV